VLKPGVRFGPYEVIAPLGKGGMGEVYRARDTKLDRNVALKVLPEEVISHPNYKSRFEREARVLASLNHPNIAAIHGLEEGDGVHALVLELVEGTTLADRLARGPLRVDEALRVAQQIAAALETAHEHGIVHRDLKPANVMLRSDGLVKVLDFGLAKLADPEPSSPDIVATRATDATRPGTILGTPAYMAPEQFGGETVSKRADIWAFGTVLFEMLTGQQAFSGADVPRVLADIVSREPRWDALPADTPQSIRRLLRRCLAKEQTERLRDIADIRLEIQDALAHDREEAASLAPVAPRRSRRAIVLGLGALAVILVVIDAIDSGRWNTSTTDRATTVAKNPLVIMMDSPVRRRVYDPETLAANGSNADVISDILSDLPIRRQKESIGPGWHRDEEVKQFDPDLIIVHYSGFEGEDVLPTEPRERLKTLIKFFAETPTQFVIYSRQTDASLNATLTTLLADLYSQHPGLHARIHGFGMNDHGPPRWINSSSGAELKLLVKNVLQLR
jgi:serine/threonine protein kinase